MSTTYHDVMSQIEVSPGGIGFIRTPVQKSVPVPDGARRKSWVTGIVAPQSKAVRAPRPSRATRKAG
ncbi:hypothetical protein [Mesorhizobium japonicum]|uniref:hypothetical protein n=1 Tax=Mesorhizobium japonicum TaxID=2066070 RepID=UPI003B5B741D